PRPWVRRKLQLQSRRSCLSLAFTHTHTHNTHTKHTQHKTHTHTHTHTHTTQMWGGKKASKHGWMVVCNKPQRGRSKAEGGLQRDGGGLVKRQQHTEPRKHT